MPPSSPPPSLVRVALLLTVSGCLPPAVPPVHGPTPWLLLLDSGTVAEPDTGTPSPSDARPAPEDGPAYDGSSGGHGGDEDDCEDRTGAEGDPLAAPGPCGTLVYGPYSARDDERPVHRLPDFSWAGFGGGGVALPTVDVVETVSPGSGDDTARIQSVIDRVAEREPSADGFRGAILLEAGTYQCASTLRIRASGIVLRGEGQGEDGTVLVATADSRMDLIEVGDGGAPSAAADPVTIVDDLVPVGATSLRVGDTAGLEVGQAVAVVRTPNRDWIEAIEMDDLDWSAGSFQVSHDRRLTEVDHAAGTVELDIPLVDAIEAAFGGGELVVLDAGSRVHHVGIEDLRLDSTYDGSTDDQHGWNAVVLDDVENAWVARITVEHFAWGAVVVDGASRFITVQDVAAVDPISPISGGYRYPFAVKSGLGVLFQRCYARDGRHNFVAQSRVAGPNVWLDCLAEDSHADDGPHLKWATGLLFDNTRSTQLRVQNRAWSGSGHGWSGAQVMFWNSAVSEEFVSDAPPHAMNWVVGIDGPEGDGQWVPEEPPGIQESLGEPVLPRSLYLQQLADRLGEDAVLATTTEDQREGRIWTVLADWAGTDTPDHWSAR